MVDYGLLDRYLKEEYQERVGEVVLCELGEGWGLMWGFRIYKWLSSLQWSWYTMLVS